MERNRSTPISRVAAGLLVWLTAAASPGPWRAYAQGADPVAPDLACGVTSPGMAPGAGFLQIDTTILGAILRLDGGAPIAAAGFRCPVAAGSHDIEISAPGYQTLRQWVRVVGYGTLRLRPQLVRSPGAPPAPRGGDAETALASTDLDMLGATRGLAVAAVEPRRPPGAAALARPNVPRPLPKPALPPSAAAAVASAASVGSPDPAPAAVEPFGERPLSFRTVQEAIDATVTAHVAFNAPHRMQRGEPRVIEARLAIDIPPDVLIEQVTEAGRKIVRSLRVSPRMIAALSGGGAFEVSPSLPQSQLVGREPTVWTWQVTPKKKGRQYLMLTFDAVLNVEGREAAYSVRTLKQEIEVEVGWSDWVKDGLAWLKGLVENLAWLWLTILVPIGLWFWRRIGKRLWLPRRRRPRPPKNRRVAPSGRSRIPEPEFEFTAKGIPFVGGTVMDVVPSPSSPPPAV
jgi:hypothetical protein